MSQTSHVSQVSKLSKDTAAHPLNPKTTHYEFFGPPGAFAVTVGTPACTYFLYYYVSPTSYRLFSWTAAGIYVNWFIMLVMLWYLLPGKTILGTPLRNGRRLSYKMNGLSSLAVVATLVAAGLAYDAAFLEPLVTEFLPLITVSLVVSILLAAWSWHVSCASGDELLAEGGNTGSFIYDYFIGRALNPRIGNFDVKVFCELRPGLFLWLLLDVAFMMHQYIAIHRITASMLLIVVFQGWYVIDSVLHESAVLSTMDVTTDGFGFMLAFGDLTWVPFTYSLQARYLAQTPVELGAYAYAIIAIQLAGYYIFRSANSQKDLFRSDSSHPSVANLAFVQTDRGTRLLAEGWWGRARHINYLGDWIMAWAWCLPTGTGNPLTYFYVIYFGVLLVHRERRDEEKCAKKYGAAWQEYKTRVPYRIIPFLY